MSIFKNSNSDCLISVIVPVYNRVEKIDRLAELFELQTNQDFELVLVNDGSTDDTLASLQRLAARRRNTIVHNIEQSGPSRARNEGARQASCSHLVFIDSDDEFRDNFLDTYLSSIRSEEPALVQSGIVVKDVNSGKRQVLLPQPTKLSHPILRPFLSGTYCINAELFWSVGGFTETLRYSEHRELALKLAERSRSHPIRQRTVDEAFYTYISTHANTPIYDERRTAAARYILENHKARLADAKQLLTYNRILLTGHAKLGQTRQFVTRALALLKEFPMSPIAYLTTIKGFAHLLKAHWNSRMKTR